MDEKMTLRDVVSQLNTPGQALEVAEVLHQHAPMLDDMPFYEANNGTGHKMAIRTGLPTVAWRLLNYGVPQSKATTQQVQDVCGMLETYSNIDKALLDMSGDPATVRWNEDQAFLESMAQAAAAAFIYGDTKKEAAEILGIAPRYCKLPTATTKDTDSATNVIDAGVPFTDGEKLTSIYLVGFGPQSVFGIYPQGSKHGLQVEDKGQHTIKDAKGGEYEAMRTHYKWDLGLAIKDWRYVVRICNIPMSKLNEVDFDELTAQAASKLPSVTLAKPVFYARKEVILAMKRQYKKAGNVHLSMEEVQAGIKQLHADGIMVKRFDAIKNDEAKVN